MDRIGLAAAPHARGGNGNARLRAPVRRGRRAVGPDRPPARPRLRALPRPGDRTSPNGAEGARGARRPARDAARDRIARRLPARAARVRHGEDAVRRRRAVGLHRRGGLRPAGGHPRDDPEVGPQEAQAAVGRRRGGPRGAAPRSRGAGRGLRRARCLPDRGVRAQGRRVGARGRPRAFQLTVAYLDLLRLPGAARLAFAALVGRIPISMVPLTYILLLRAVGESFALAGAVAAAFAVAAGLSAMPQGRLVDRLGQPRVLPVFGIAHAAATVAVLLAARGGAAAWALIALGALDGLAIPPLSASMRTLWPVLTGGGERLETAFALEAVLQEGFYIAGPLIVGAVVALASPDAAVVTAAARAVLGTLPGARPPVARLERGRPCDPGRLAPTAAPDERTIVVVLFPD